MRPCTETRRALRWTDTGRRCKDHRSGTTGNGHLAMGKVLPLVSPRRKTPEPLRPEAAALRVRELKAQVQSGRYRVDSARVAEQMLRAALLEQVLCPPRTRRRRIGRRC